MKREGCHTSVATERSSAPVVFGHNLAIKSKRIFLSTLMLALSVNMKILLRDKMNQPSGMDL
jgi:hypothetical protein